jgi:hypothetical protein
VRYFEQDAGWKVCANANAIVMLPGWEVSHGAQCEHRCAVALRAHGEAMLIIYLSEDDCALAEEAES